MLLGTINLLLGVKERFLICLWMSFVLNCQIVEWVDIFANPVFKNPGIFTCTINAIREVSWLPADTSEGSFDVMAYGAAVTVVFFCCALVYVCKTGGASIQFAFFAK